MAVEVRVPSVGESITEVQLARWLKQPGDAVALDEPLVVIDSDKTSIELPSPAAGRLGEILKGDGENATVDELIATIEEGDGAAAESSPPNKEQKKEAKAAAPEPEPKQTTPPAESRPKKSARTAAEKPKPAGPDAEPAPPSSGVEPPLPAAETEDDARVMPAARRLLREHGLRASQAPASGPGGRLLKEDVERYIDGHRNESVAASAEASPSAPAYSRPDGSEKIVPMTPMRRTIARRLVDAQQTGALLTTFNEIDMSAVMDLRKRYRDSFQERHGVKLGFMSFFVKATVDALTLFPQVNAEIRGADIVYHNYFDIGIAIGSGSKGLVVPVLRDADRLTFAQLEIAIADFGARAKENKIDLDELKGGTFTITNGGVYGSLLSTPIVNPPQSAILGMHAIQDRPMAVDGQVVVRPMMYIALTYDHRLVDGREAVTFLRRIKECVEEPSRMLMEI
jgi:2-oxoglutarate dehydrogenase E2 component (dihydrolipoamide succinyltransferase)